MSDSNKQIHNNFFIRQFGDLEFAVSFFKAFLPSDISKLVDWTSFRLAPGDFVNKALKNRKSDILYQTRIAEKKAFFYLHLEHQRTPDNEMPYRFIIYMANIWQLHKMQYPEEAIPLIFPMVLFQGDKRWTSPLTLHDFLDVPSQLKPYIPDFCYDLLDLSHLSDEEIQDKLILSVGLLIMKHIDSKNINEYVSQNLLSLILELLETKTGLEYIEAVLKYLFEGSEHLEKEKFIQTLQDKTKSQVIKEVCMTVAEQLRKEGMEEGIEKGILKGMEKGILKGKEEKIETAIKFLKLGIVTHEQISIGTGLSISEIEELEKTIRKY